MVCEPVSVYMYSHADLTPSNSILSQLNRVMLAEMIQLPHVPLNPRQLADPTATHILPCTYPRWVQIRHFISLLLCL